MNDDDSVIVDALKSEDVYDIRITCGDKWLYWSAIAHCYVVLQHKYAAKKTATICETENIAMAMKALTQ